MTIDLATLGFTNEELQERVIDRICEQLLTGIDSDPDSGDEYQVASTFRRGIDNRVKAKIEETINAIAEREVLPNVTTYIESLVLQETNSWGEKRGNPVTFREYLVQRAEAYMQEKVDFQGKSKAEAGGYSWNGTQTRITHLVHQHLHYSIESAMKDAMKAATGSIAIGITETVKTKLAEVSAKLKTEVKIAS